MYKTLRRFPRILKTSLQKKSFSAQRTGSFFGYECSQYAHRDYDLNLLEKSIRYGCQTVIEKSAADDSIRTYELLVDVAAAEDVELSDFFLVHLIGNKLEQDAVSVETELSDIQHVLRKKFLDIVAVPIPTLKSLSDKYGAIDSEKNVLQKFLHGHLKEQFTEICLHCSEATNFGVDVSTEWLANASVVDVRDLIVVLGEFNDNCDKCEKTTDSTANRMKKIKCLTIATNSYTHKHLSAIHAWAATRDIQVVATEVLRGHFSRPGLLSVEGGRLNLTPTKPGPTESNKDVPINNDPSVVTLAAVADFNRAINACVHAEKEYIKRFSTISDAVPANALCWGHNLSQAQHSILFPEEWDYFYAHQVKGTLSDATDEFKNKGSKEKEWTMLYHPLSKKMFADFNTFLEKRRTELCHEVYTSITAGVNSAKGAPENAKKDWSAYKDLPRCMAAITAKQGADKVVVASAVVRATSWLENTDALAASLIRKTSNEDMFDSIGKVLHKFNTPDQQSK